tara:strand:- start:1188 stop:1460 length:273 start_codon:yes stop_codon:yes gene_type:complete
MDLILPKLDGLTLCQRLRRDDRTSSIPLLMLTSVDELKELKDKVTGFNSGADEYLLKPFDLEELLYCIKPLFRRINKIKPSSRNIRLRST